jgi:lipopolysaccharide biosynthesis protein
LAPLLKAPIEGFQDELGQTDGTLAHAVERSLCLIASLGGYKPAQINTVKNRVCVGPGMKNLQRYIAMSEKNAYRFIKGFKYVVFDLFGTLVMPDGRPRTAVVSLLNKLSKKHTVAIAEDTGLTSPQVREILKKCGVEGQVEIFSSSETGCKKEDGSLYDMLTRRYKGRGFVNVGDDELADSFMPNMRGIHHLHVMHPDDMAAVIGLKEPTPQQYARMIEDPFCLLEIMRMG